jgi:imidazolonepropionase-like amidohydrolase
MDKIMTANGYKVCDIYDKRGPLKAGLPADIIAVKGNPLEDIDALRTMVRDERRAGLQTRRRDDTRAVSARRSHQWLENP